MRDIQQEIGSSDMRLRETHFESEEAIVSYVDRLHDASKRIKWPFEKQWFIALNFFMGRQYIIPTDATREFHVPSDPKHRVRHVVNKIKPYVKTLISKLTRQEPIPEVSPASSDLDDLQKARIANGLVEFWNQDLGIQRILTDRLFPWVAICGTGFLRPFWNPSRGRPWKLKRGEVSSDIFSDAARVIGRKMRESDEEIGEMDEVDASEGDCDIAVVSPFAFFCNPNAVEVNDSLWVLESNVRDMDALNEQWGPASEEVSPDGDADWRDWEQRLLGSDLQQSDVWEHLGSGKRAEFPKVVEKQLWIRPCRMFPDGKFCVVAGKKVLHDGPFPYDHGRLPYICFRDNSVPNRLWGQATVEDLIPIQKAINSKKSKFHENFNLMARPKFLNPKDSGVSDASFTNAPGEVISHNSGSPPTILPPPPMPAYAENMIAQDMTDFEEVSGQHEATKGDAPGRVDSAEGLIALQEADDSRLGPNHRSNAVGLGEVWSQMLSLAHQFYDVDRLVRIRGRSGIIEARTFQGTDLEPKGFSGRFDVRAQIGSGLPLSRGARSQFVLSLVEKGLFSPQNPEDREMVLRILEVGGPREAIFERAENDRAQAHIENMEMALGIAHSVNTWDVHSVHKQIHNEFRRRPDYLMEVEKNPAIDQYLESHIRRHEEAEALEGMRQSQLHGPAPTNGAAQPVSAAPPVPQLSDVPQSPMGGMS